MDQKIYLKEEKIYEAFKTFDKDGSGKISTEEVKQILKVENDDIKMIEEMIQSFDINKDGEIDYNEFLTMMGGQVLKK
jgi:Ca2+-binding EF-hand superfamily protein